MTLIVGVLCEDGVVLGADGAATLGSLGHQTARQPVKKLTKVGQRVIVGVSGPVGLGQLLVDQVDDLSSNKHLTTKCKTPAEAMRWLSDAFKADILPALERARYAAQVIGSPAAQGALSATVVALPVRKTPTLIQFDQQCGPEAATADLPFVAVGSGQSTADPFLAFVRRVFWQDRLPSVPEGILAATWTLRQAIDTSPGGIADPIQMMVLEGEQVRELSEADLDEHEQAVRDLERHVASYKDELREATKDDVATPPTP